MKGKKRVAEEDYVMVCPKCGSDKLEKKFGIAPFYPMQLLYYYHCPDCDYSGLSYHIKETGGEDQ